MGLLEHLKSLAGIDEWDFSDRRGTLRIPCNIKAKLHSKSGEVLDVEIVDVGLRGLQMRFEGKLRKGSVATLRGASKDTLDQSLECKIEWKKRDGKGFVSGVSFQSAPEQLRQSWLFEELRGIGREAMETEQRRSGIRVICNSPAKLRMKGDNKVIKLIDLGLGGALVESDESLKKGDKVRFDFGPLDDLARVAVNSEVVVTYKRKPPRYGLKFETFFDGGVTDLERYLTYFYAKQQAED